MPNKTVKLILNIEVKRMEDTDPDTSWLGEYSNTRTSEFSIDRGHTLDCRVNAGDHILPNTLYECGICGSLHPWEFDGDCREDANRYAGYDDYASQHGIPEDAVTVLTWEERQQVDGGCTCDESGDMSRGEYRYFNPSFNYVDKNGSALPENTPEDVRKYVRQDYERMESLNRGSWGFIGIRAEAEIAIDGVIQTITSGGLWGIESDSDDSDLKETESEELSALRDILHQVGFSKRAIASAVKAAAL